MLFSLKRGYSVSGKVRSETTPGFPCEILGEKSQHSATTVNQATRSISTLRWLGFNSAFINRGPHIDWLVKGIICFCAHCDEFDKGRQVQFESKICYF